MSEHHSPYGGELKGDLTRPKQLAKDLKGIAAGEGKLKGTLLNSGPPATAESLPLHESGFNIDQRFIQRDSGDTWRIVGIKPDPRRPGDFLLNLVNDTMAEKGRQGVKLTKSAETMKSQLAVEGSAWHY